MSDTNRPPVGLFFLACTSHEPSPRSRARPHRGARGCTYSRSRHGVWVRESVGSSRADVLVGGRELAEAARTRVAGGEAEALESAGVPSTRGGRFYARTRHNRGRVTR